MSKHIADATTEIRPYMGLDAFDEQDAPFFFGRDRDIRRIISSFYGFRLTVLFGSSGVGKSSVLNAGVLRQSRGDSNLLMTVFRVWTGDIIKGIKEEVRAAAAKIGDPPTLSPELPLAEFLLDYAMHYRRHVIVILDQFEDYLRDYHQGHPFDQQFVNIAVNRSMPVSLLVALRRDAVADLHRYEESISTLWEGLIEIDHLDEEAATLAIRGPLEEFERQTGKRMTIKDDLIKAILERVSVTDRSVRTARWDGPSTAGEDEALRKRRIETPFLQLVMMRLWKEERQAGSWELQKSTFEKKLGGAKAILRAHVGSVLDPLPPRDREPIIEIFRYLVTPSGAKVSYALKDLSDLAGVGQNRLARILDGLAGEARILRKNTREEVSYELFHDVLGEPVLEWRNQYEAAGVYNGFSEIFYKASELIQQAQQEIWHVNFMIEFGRPHQDDPKIAEIYRRYTNGNDLKDDVKSLWEELQKKVRQLPHVRILTVSDSTVKPNFLELLQKRQQKHGYHDMKVKEQYEQFKASKMLVKKMAQKRGFSGPDSKCEMVEVNALPIQLLIVDTPDAGAIGRMGCLVFMVGTEVLKAQEQVVTGYYTTLPSVVNMYKDVARALMSRKDCKVCFSVP